MDIYTNGRSYLLTEGDILILAPQQLHTFRTVTMDTRYIHLSIQKKLIELPQEHFFQRDFVEPLFNGQLRLPELIRPDDPLYPAIHSALQILDRQKEGSAEYKTQLFSAIVAFCACLMPHCTPISPKELAENDQQHTILACLNYIKAHYTERVTLQAMADHVHLHPNYLCALFKEHTGRTVFEYLERYRVRKAVHLLRSTNLPISRIAERCGFNSISFFSRKFHAITGFSPLQYRKHYVPIPPQAMDEALPL